MMRCFVNFNGEKIAQLESETATLDFALRLAIAHPAAHIEAMRRWPGSPEDPTHKLFAEFIPRHDRLGS